MYSGGLIKGASDWDAWDKSRVFRMPELTGRIYSRIQKDFGDRIFIFGCFHGGLFELSWQSMGFEEFVRATRRERKHIERVIRFLTDLYCMMLEAMADAGLPGVIYPDDLAYRSGSMLNPKMLEELYGDSFRRITATAHLYGMKAVVHTCGNVYSLLDWLADCGFDGIHGLEPTAGVELAKAKEIIGGRMCLVGNIDVTHVLVDAGREEVFEAVRQAIQDAGAGGGYMVANTNTHPDIKVRNCLDARGGRGVRPLSHHFFLMGEYQQRVPSAHSSTPALRIFRRFLRWPSPCTGTRNSSFSQVEKSSHSQHPRAPPSVRTGRCDRTWTASRRGTPCIGA